MESRLWRHSVRQQRQQRQQQQQQEEENTTTASAKYLTKVFIFYIFLLLLPQHSNVKLQMFLTFCRNVHMYILYIFAICIL